MVALSKPRMRMSVEAFLAWEPKDGRVWQLVDGEPHAMAPPGAVHAAIHGELAALIRNHLLDRRSDCRVLVGPGIVPRVRARHNVRIPDLSVSCTPLAPGQALVPDPVLAIEILSPSNQAETWANVWTYTTIPSVAEILVINASAIGAELLRRQPDGTWPEQPEAITTGDLILRSIDFRAPIAAIYRTTPLTTG